MLKDLLKKFHLISSTVETSAALLNPTQRHPIRLLRGEGSNVSDDEGRQYIDAAASFSGNLLGHCHTRVSEAISLQASKLLTIDHHFHCQEEDAFAERFCQISGLDKVDISDTTEQAISAALLFTSYFALTKNVNQPTVLTTNARYCSQRLLPTKLDQISDPSTAKPQSPLNLVQVPFGDIDQIAQVEQFDSVVAVLIEPICWNNPTILSTNDYLQTVRQYCDEQGWLLIIDESDMSIAGNGTWMTHQQADILPDILIGPSALANNLGLGICAVTENVAALAETKPRPSHLGGSALACQIALTIIEEIEEQNLLVKATETAEFLKRQIQQRICTLDAVSEIQSRGLMLAIKLDKSYPSLEEKLLASGLLVNLNKEHNLIRLFPAVNLDQPQAKQIAQILHNVLLTL